MDITVKHILPVAEAKSRILKLSDELKKEYGNQIKNYSETWNGNDVEIAFKAMGIKINGNLKIFPDKVTMNGKLPLMARPYKTQIESLIKGKLLELLK